MSAYSVVYRKTLQVCTILPNKDGQPEEFLITMERATGWDEPKFIMYVGGYAMNPTCIKERLEHSAAWRECLARSALTFGAPLYPPTAQ